MLILTHLSHFLNKIYVHIHTHTLFTAHTTCRNKLRSATSYLSEAAFYLKLFYIFQPVPHFNNHYLIITIISLLAWHFIFLALWHPTVEGKENSLLISYVRPATITVGSEGYLERIAQELELNSLRQRAANYKPKYFIACNQIG